MTEAELRAEVLAKCEGLGLAVLYIPDSRLIQQHGKGWPDLTITGPHGILFAELKDGTGQLSPEQTRWLYQLRAAGQQFRIWRPVHWWSGEIEKDLETIR